MDFDLEDIELSEEQKELDGLRKEYKQKGFREFDTWHKTMDEIKNELKICIRENKSHEKLYGEDEIKENIDY